MTFFFLLIIRGSTDKRALVSFAPLATVLALTLIHLMSIPVTNLGEPGAQHRRPCSSAAGAGAVLAVLGRAACRCCDQRLRLQVARRRRERCRNREPLTIPQNDLIRLAQTLSRGQPSHQMESAMTLLNTALAYHGIAAPPWLSDRRHIMPKKNGSGGMSEPLLIFKGIETLSSFWHLLLPLVDQYGDQIGRPRSTWRRLPRSNRRVRLSASPSPGPGGNRLPKNADVGIGPRWVTTISQV